MKTDLMGRTFLPGGVFDDPASEDQYKQRQTWQYRAIEATGGPQTKLGAIVLAMLGQQRQTMPQFGGQAIILENSTVICDMHDKAGQPVGAVVVSDVDDLVENFSRLGDHLRLNDEDRIAMFTKVREWIFKDYRKDQTLHFTVRHR